MKSPSFKARTGRSPVNGQDYDNTSAMCQDDYEFYAGTGRYTDDYEFKLGMLPTVYGVGSIWSAFHPAGHTLFRVTRIENGVCYGKVIGGSAAWDQEGTDHWC